MALVAPRPQHHLDQCLVHNYLLLLLLLVCRLLLVLLCLRLRRQQRHLAVTLLLLLLLLHMSCRGASCSSWQGMARRQNLHAAWTAQQRR